MATYLGLFFQISSKSGQIVAVQIVAVTPHLVYNRPVFGVGMFFGGELLCLVRIVLVGLQRDSVAGNLAAALSLESLLLLACPLMGGGCMSKRSKTGGCWR